MAGHPEFQVYEVFVQSTQLSPHTWVGSIDAGSPEDALILAREAFLRREKAVSIWVVPADQIHGTDYEDPDFFAQETDKAYRLTSGYTADNARRWRRYKRELLDIEKDFVTD